VWLREKEVQKVMMKEKIPFSEAAKHVVGTVSPGLSFAAVAASDSAEPAVVRRSTSSQAVGRRSVGLQTILIDHALMPSEESQLEKRSVFTQTDSVGVCTRSRQTFISYMNRWDEFQDDWIGSIAALDDAIHHDDAVEDKWMNARARIVDRDQTERSPIRFPP
jgi:hypothetical protein